MDLNLNFQSLWYKSLKENSEMTGLSCDRLRVVEINLEKNGNLRFTSERLEEPQNIL